MENLLLVDYKQFIKNHADFLSNSSSQILNDSYSSCIFSDLFVGDYKDFSFARTYFCSVTSSRYNKPVFKDFKSLFILKNPHIDLPCFYTQKDFSFSRYSVKLGNKTDFYIIGRPEKLIRYLLQQKYMKLLQECIKI